MREEEREMHPFCLDQGVGVIPWSPLARGRLTRPWGEQTNRSQHDGFGASLYRQAEEADREVVSAVASVAETRGVPMAQVALAWMLHKPAVTAPILGVTRGQHLVDALAAVVLELGDDEIDRLEAAYVPHAPEGF
jgi:aryl-alcohol dehydrogenase-like predicted oxidoreductase